MCVLQGLREEVLESSEKQQWAAGALGEFWNECLGKQQGLRVVLLERQQCAAREESLEESGWKAVLHGNKREERKEMPFCDLKWKEKEEA